MKYISLFAGIGGFDLALNRLGHECVYANDFDKYCKITYDKNFTTNNFEETQEERNPKSRTDKSDSNGEQGSSRGSKSTNGGLDTTNLKDVPTSEIPDHDLLVGGFPCQAFSIAGKRRGFDDTRGTLFFDIARILKDKRPRHFILENVKGLLSHDEGKTFQTILGVLSDLGYEYQWQVLNSKNFGVPQNRERVFIVGHIRGEPRPKVFPIGEDNSVDNGQDGEKLQSPIVNTITSSFRGSPDGANRPGIIYQLNKPKHRNDRVYGGNGVSPTLNTMQGGRRQPKVMITDKKGNPKNKDYASTLTGGAHSGGNHSDMDLLNYDMRIRRLTPLECERLQGFPDNWTEGVSDTQRYKQLGNAVTVNVVYEVAKRL